MLRSRCDRCGNRIRIRSFRCRHCNRKDPSLQSLSPRSTVRRRVGFGIGITLGLVALLFIGQRMIEPTTIADWYAEFAIQHLPRHFSNFAPAETPSGAFYFCIRRVVKDALQPESVATFPSSTPENTVLLGEQRYQVSTHVIEDQMDGERVRKLFTCTTRYERGHWVLEGLSVGSHASTL
jgi:hypothetical protein